MNVYMAYTCTWCESNVFEATVLQFVSWELLQEIHLSLWLKKQGYIVTKHIYLNIPQLTLVTNGFLYWCRIDWQNAMTLSIFVTHLPSCCTEECNSERSSELSSSSSLKEESSSSMFWPSLPAIFSLASLSWTSSRVVAPPDSEPEVKYVKWSLNNVIIKSCIYIYTCACKTRSHNGSNWVLVC